MKPNHLYLFELGGNAYEGLHIATINGICVFTDGFFRCTEGCPRRVEKKSIVWFKEICQMTPNLSENDYNKALTEISE